MADEPEFILVQNTRELPQDEWMEMASACRDRQEAIQAFKQMRGMDPKTIYEYHQTTGVLYFAAKE